MTKAWCVYMVRCRDEALYTGITNDIDRRMAEHNSGRKGARYTRARRPVHLVYFEVAENRSLAAKREYQIKQLSSSEKREMVKGGFKNPDTSPGG